MTSEKFLDMNRNTKKLNIIKPNNKLKSQNFTELTCDVCKSSDIVETHEGYVCRDCGIVLEIQRLEYYRPYNDDIIQYALLGTTQIGSKRERLNSSNSKKLEKLNKLHSIKENSKIVLEKARIEISRIFNGLNLPDSFKKLVFEKFKRIRDVLQPGTKYRNPDKLVPIVIYFCLKLQNISINEENLLEVSKISKKDFNTFKLQIINFIPNYNERNRKKYVLQKVLEISEHFQLGMPFYYQSKKILYKLWEGIKCTKDDVIAGLVSSISLLCSFKNEINVNAICKRLGIKMSTIQSQVKKRIFERFNIPGFVSLVKSSDLLKKILIRMGLIEPQQDSIDGSSFAKEVSEVQTVVESVQSPEIVEIQLDNAIQVFNSNNEIENFFYALRNDNGYPLFVNLKLHNPTMSYEYKDYINWKDNDTSEVFDDRLFELEIIKYHSNKDPPSF